MNISAKIMLLTVTTLALFGCNQAPTIDYVKSGLAKEQQTDYQGALADYTKATGANPKDDNAYYLKANIERFLSGDFFANHDKAIADYTKAIELNPTIPYYYLWRGMAKQEIDKDAEALADFNEAEKRGLTESKVLLLNRSYSKEALGDKEGAAQDRAAADQQI